MSSPEQREQLQQQTFCRRYNIDLPGFRAALQKMDCTTKDWEDCMNAQGIPLTQTISVFKMLDVTTKLQCIVPHSNIATDLAQFHIVMKLDHLVRVCSTGKTIERILNEVGGLLGIYAYNGQEKLRKDFYEKLLWPSWNTFFENKIHNRTKMEFQKLMDQLKWPDVEEVKTILERLDIVSGPEIVRFLERVYRTILRSDSRNAYYPVCGEDLARFDVIAVLNRLHDRGLDTITLMQLCEQSQKPLCELSSQLIPLAPVNNRYDNIDLFEAQVPQPDLEAQVPQPYASLRPLFDKDSLSTSEFNEFMKRLIEAIGSTEANVLSYLSRMNLPRDKTEKFLKSVYEIILGGNSRNIESLQFPQFSNSNNNSNNKDILEVLQDFERQGFPPDKLMRLCIRLQKPLSDFGQELLQMNMPPEEIIERLLEPLAAPSMVLEAVALGAFISGLLMIVFSPPVLAAGVGIPLLGIAFLCYSNSTIKATCDGIPLDFEQGPLAVSH